MIFPLLSLLMAFETEIHEEARRPLRRVSEIPQRLAREAVLERLQIEVGRRQPQIEAWERTSRNSLTGQDALFFRGAQGTLRLSARRSEDLRSLIAAQSEIARSMLSVRPVYREGTTERTPESMIDARWGDQIPIEVFTSFVENFLVGLDLLDEAGFRVESTREDRVSGLLELTGCLRNCRDRVLSHADRDSVRYHQDRNRFIYEIHSTIQSIVTDLRRHTTQLLEDPNPTIGEVNRFLFQLQLARLFPHPTESHAEIAQPVFALSTGTDLLPIRMVLLWKELLKRGLTDEQRAEFDTWIEEGAEGLPPVPNGWDIVDGVRLVPEPLHDFVLVNPNELRYLFDAYRPYRLYAVSLADSNTILLVIGNGLEAAVEEALEYASEHGIGFWQPVGVLYAEIAEEHEGLDEEQIGDRFNDEFEQVNDVAISRQDISCYDANEEYLIAVLVEASPQLRVQVEFENEEGEPVENPGLPEEGPVWEIAWFCRNQNLTATLYEVEEPHYRIGTISNEGVPDLNFRG